MGDTGTVDIVATEQAGFKLSVDMDRFLHKKTRMLILNWYNENTGR